MEKLLKIGFIGCGAISYRHLKVLKNTREVEITGVFDPNKNNVEKFIQEAGGDIGCKAMPRPPRRHRGHVVPG